MENIKIHFRNHLFFYILTSLVIIVGVFSYFRFMVKHDYLVGYEGTCDPTIQKCFVGCEDDACTTDYYYSKMIKYAPDLYKECGADITDCEAASVCLPEDRKCSITYCDSGVSENTCSVLVEKTGTESINQTNPVDSEPLQNNDSNNIKL